MADLYHHTDTARLPFILQSGELRPGKNRIGGFPSPDFLWATTSANGDRTATAHRGPYWRSGSLWHARFVLDEALFERWSDARERLLNWTDDQIKQLESSNGAVPETWWCRVDPLPLSACKALEVRSYSVNRWRPAVFEQPTAVAVDDGEGLQIDIGGRVFKSARYAPSGPFGSVSYDVL